MGYISQCIGVSTAVSAISVGLLPNPYPKSNHTLMADTMPICRCIS